jgi:hypothetical protein
MVTSDRDWSRLLWLGTVFFTFTQNGKSLMVEDEDKTIFNRDAYERNSFRSVANSN